jgi:hypothetical protein
MAAPSVTYTFSNSTAADATEVNQNFDDIINGISDGTKDLTISAFTANGAASFNGNVTLGNATGDDITFTGRIASDFDPKTAGANTLGDATQTWRALYLDNTSTDGGAIYFDASSTKFLKANAAGTDLSMGGFTHLDLVVGHSIKHFGRYLEAKSANYTITDTDGVSVVAVTTSTTNRTITLPTASANTYRIITVKKVDSGSGTVTVDGEGSETIDGETTYTLTDQYSTVTLICDGSEWFITASEDYEEQVISSLGGGYSAGGCTLVRIGKTVTLTGDSTWTHSSINRASSSVGVVNSSFRPSDSLFVCYTIDGSGIARIEIDTAGTISTRYYDSSFADSSQTSSIVPPVISYVIT